MAFYDMAELIPFIPMWFVNLYLDDLDLLWIFKSRIYTVITHRMMNNQEFWQFLNKP